MKYSVNNIKSILNANEFGEFVDDIVITDIVYDTRKITFPAESMFVALKGQLRDGHDFVQSAYEKGIRVFLVEMEYQIPIEYVTHCIFLKVANPIESIQILAANHRKQFYIPIVGITGSNGKTVVKEWLGELLSRDFKIYKSPRSFNSQLGVAVSMLALEKSHNLGVFEAGISQHGEMDALWNMIQPSLTVITHLGSPHDAGFENRKQKAQEKIKLCKNADVVIVPKDIEDLQSELLSLKKNQPLTKIISWGYNEGATFRLLNVERTNLGQKIHFQNRGTEHFIEIPFIDEASVANAMTCFCVLFAFERWDEKHIDLFKQLKPVNNRLTIEKGRRGNVILNDSYSNDFESLAIAFDVIQRQQPNLPLKLIVSEMEQVSNNVELEQQKIAQLFESKHIDSIIYLGSEPPKFLDNFNVLHFTDTLSLIQSGCLNLISNAAVLVKGARKYQLEQVVEHLKERLHKTSLEIDLDAIKHNFRYFKHKISPNTKMMCMVKAFGYGSGTFEVSKTLQDLGADYLGVAFADEGVLLREAGIKVPIMVMNTDAQTMNLLNQYHLEPVVYSAANLNAYMNLLGTNHGEIHLEIDTGMHRLGFGTTEILDSVRLIPENIKVKSVFTHLAVSEDASKDAFTESQAKQYYETVAEIESILGYVVIKHISNTGGIQRFAELQSDMVRLGIGLYGLMPDGTENSDLHAVATLSSTITQIHTVLPFEGIGYGQHNPDTVKRKIATIAMGYADGLSRRFGKKVGGVLINGIFAPFVGNICMDMAMIDVTEIDCQEGDSVEIFGKNLSINEMSHRGGTISYEILTNISQRVPRIYLGEN